LNSIYDKEEALVKELKQLQEDKEMLKMIIMHQSNKEARVNNV